MTAGVSVRNTEPRDFDSIIELGRKVYTGSGAWTA
jgi:hypothetical protein